MDPLQQLHDQITRVFSGKKWLVALDHAMPASDFGRSLLDLGASSVYAIGASRGHGEPAEGVPTLWADVHGDSMMHAIRACEATLHDLPADMRAALDAWDSGREARVIRALFSDDTPVADRACFGARPKSWVALEDKTVIDAFWDEVGMARAQSTVVPCTRDALLAAHRDLDAGDGTVWAGDSRSGWHGGAQYTRWVHDEATADAALNTLSAACDTARVMPFLRGIPCSIHGIVLPNDVIALRPCEMVVFNDATTGAFTYGMAATHWEPPLQDREDMRALARRVGAALRDRVGFRGAFTLDGVLTRDGFRPTELNPRFGAALNVLARSVPDLPLYLWHVCLVAGHAPEVPASDIEHALLERMDAVRHASCSVSSSTSVTAQQRLGLRRDGASWSVCDADDSTVTASIGPTASGSRIALLLDPNQLPPGAQVAPLAIDAVRVVARHCGLEVPALAAAEDVRTA